MPSECWALELAQGKLRPEGLPNDRVDPIYATFWVVVNIVPHDRPRDTLENSLVDWQGHVAIISSGKDLIRYVVRNINQSCKYNT